MSKRTLQERISAGSLSWILAVFTCTYFVYRDFGLRTIVGFLVLGLALAIHLWDRLRRNDPPRVDEVSAALLVLAAIHIVFYLLPGARRDESIFAYMVSMAVSAAYVCAAPAEPGRVRAAEGAMYTMAMAMAVFVVVFSFLPELFVATVYPLFTEVARRYYDYFVPLGYGVCLGGYSYCDYVIFLGVAVCLARLAAGHRSPGFLVGSALSLSVILLAMVVLGRRGELLAALAASAVLVLGLLDRKKRRIMLVAGTVLVAAGAVLVVTFLPQLSTIPMLSRYVETVQQILSGTDFAAGRFALMEAAVKGFRAHPLFGVGYGQYAKLAEVVGMYDTNGKLIDDCHNIYLQFLCENGIFGAALLLIPIGYLLVTTCRMLRHAKYLTDKLPLELSCISFMIQFFLLFLGLYDPSFQKLVFWCFYALALLCLRGAMNASGWRPEGPLSRQLRRLTDGLNPVLGKVWEKLHGLLGQGA